MVQAQTPTDGAGNIAGRLRAAAAAAPERTAVVARVGGIEREWTFRELDTESDRLALGLAALGGGPGTRLVLFVRFSWEFVTLTFAIFKAGATVVLIDPGMGRANIFECLREVQPDGFVAIPMVQIVRWWKRSLFPRARLNVTVGPRWFPGGPTYGKLRAWGARQLDEGTSALERLPVVRAEDPAAVIFTSGSTGPPKGVLYEHGMFDAQVDIIRDFYGIAPGEVDLPGFPLFGLFNAAMGVTTVIPEMDPTRPAEVDPRKIVDAIHRRAVTQAFGSPAFWNRVGRFCEAEGVSLPTIRRGLSAGGPVPLHVLRRMTRAFTGPGADLHTPYGATESLPVASIGGREVLERTAGLTAQGRGTCVGRPFPGVDVRIIPISEGPIESLEEVGAAPPGEIGEIVVRSRSVTREYFQRPEATRLAKIAASANEPGGEGRELPGFYHRIGDVGYFDEAGLLWFCGRKTHIVESPQGRMFSVCCEAIFDEHPEVYRSALVGVGARGSQQPVIVVEPEPGRYPESPDEINRLRADLLAVAAAHPLTASIETVLFHRSLPVDTRHNVKINREALAEWAVRVLKSDAPQSMP